MHDNATRKSLSFQIRRLHRQGSRQWKQFYSGKNSARWKELQHMSSYTSKPLHQHPPLDEFAMMLTNCSLELRKRLSFDRGTLDRNHGSNRKIKMNKSADECGLVAAFFFLAAPFRPHEGPLAQSCFTGQFPGTDCFYTGQSPDVLEGGKV